MNNFYKILCLNVANNSTLSGLLSILNIEKPHLIMLQEITLSSEQLSILVAKFGCKAETNIDIDDKNAMGLVLFGRIISQSVKF